MKIISKFKDYYDSAAIFFDESILLLREKKEIEKSPVLSKLPFRSFELGENRHYVRERFFNTTTRTAYVDFLYFCGKVYPVYSVSNFSYGEKDEVLYFSTFEALLEQCEKDEIKIANYNFFEKRNLKQTAENLKRTNYTEVSADIFRELNAPYFLTSERDKVIVFPELKNLTKSLNKSANEVYQEIEMYISGVLGVGEKEVINISDVDKRNSKGFDNHSFKKRKA